MHHTFGDTCTIKYRGREIGYITDTNSDGGLLQCHLDTQFKIHTDQIRNVTIHANTVLFIQYPELLHFFRTIGMNNVEELTVKCKWFFNIMVDKSPIYTHIEIGAVEKTVKLIDLYRNAALHLTAFSNWATYHR